MAVRPASTTTHRSRHPFLGGRHPRATTHRGWHTGDLAGCENTLAAFVRAAAEGFHHVETDVRITADGVAVLHHDATLHRSTGHPGELAATPWTEVATLRVAGREPVPTLEETLRALPRTRLLVDVKTDSGTGPVLDVLERTDAWHRVCLAGFSDARLARLRRLAGPRLLTSAGPRTIAGLRVRSVLPVSLRSVLPVSLRSVLPVSLPSPGRFRPQVVQLPVGAGPLRVVDRRLLAQARRNGCEVDVWTVDDRAEVARLLDLGVDGIITDAPDVLRAELVARDLWERPAP